MAATENVTIYNNYCHSDRHENVFYREVRDAHTILLVQPGKATLISAPGLVLTWEKIGRDISVEILNQTGGTLTYTVTSM